MLRSTHFRSTSTPGGSVFIQIFLGSSSCTNTNPEFSLPFPVLQGNSRRNGKATVGCSLGDPFTHRLHLPLQRAPRRLRYLKLNAMVTNLNATAIADLIQLIPAEQTVLRAPEELSYCLYPTAQLLPLEPSHRRVALQGRQGIHLEPSYFSPLTLKFTRISLGLFGCSAIDPSKLKPRTWNSSAQQRHNARVSSAIKQVFPRQPAPHCWEAGLCVSV